MVEFIHTDVVIVFLCRPLGQFCRIEGLDADKKMFNICRFSAIHIEFAEVEVVQDLLECLNTLLQNLFSVSNKHKPCSRICRLFACLKRL